MASPICINWFFSRLLAVCWLLSANLWGQNRVLELDGNGSCLELPPNIFNNQTEATIEGWIKYHHLDSQARFFSFGCADQDMTVCIVGNTNTLRFQIVAQKKTHFAEITRSVQTNEWIHIAAVTGPAGMKLYGNGMLLGTNAYQGSFAAIGHGDHNLLGRGNGREVDPIHNQDTRGQIDEVRVWKTARTEEQIRQTMFQRLTGNEAGLAGLWNFDDGQANDATPGKHHGKLKGQARIVMGELPTSETLKRFAVIQGQLLDWRENPWDPYAPATILRFEQNGSLQRTFGLDNPPTYRFVTYDFEHPVELNGFDVYGHRWHTNVVLHAGDRVRIDLPSGRNIPTIKEPLRQDWLADALRERSSSASLYAALMVCRTVKEPLEKSLFEALVEEVNYLKFELAGVPARSAIQYARLPTQLNRLLIGRDRALSRLILALMSPFACVFFFLFAFNPRNRVPLYFALWVSLGMLNSWFPMHYLLINPTYYIFLETASTGQVLAGLLLLYAMFYSHLPRQFWYFTAWFALYAGIIVLAPDWRNWIASVFIYSDRLWAKLLLSAFPSIMFLETLRVVFQAIKQKRENAWLISGIFFAFLGLWVTFRLQYFGVWLSFKLSFGLFTGLLTLPLIYVGITVLLALCLARQFFQTNRKLQHTTELAAQQNQELTVANRQLAEARNKAEASAQDLAAKNVELETAHREAEEHRHAADAANQAKSRFLANMSHELRTPLTAIIGFSEMLLMEAEAAQQKEQAGDLSRIHDSAKHLLGLINDLLDLSKIEAQKMELHLETFAVADLVRDVVGTLHPLLEKKSNAFEVECPSEVGAMHADQVKVRQCLFNLLTNANKFTDRGSITLKVAREEGRGTEGGPEAAAPPAPGFVARPAAIVTFRVTDTGIGLIPEQISRLFQPFAQADSFTTRKFGGTGLGLAITKHFCAMMGGTIRVESEYGKGSTFIIELPVGAVVTRVPESTSPAPLPTSVGPVADHNCVLVIDDDPNVHRLIEKTLRPVGLAMNFALNGKEGLRLAKALRPAVITLDVLMPEMDGWAVLSALKTDPDLAGIPVIMLTIVGEKDLGFSLGAAEYLLKPIDRNQLLAVLRKYLAPARSQPVLIVEDDADLREMLRRMLEQEGHAVVGAENGLLALERLKQGTPSVILLDLMMPVMDGFQMLAELHKRPDWRSIPVAVMTAKDLTQADRQRLAGQTEKILEKGSIVREQLVREVRALVNQLSAS